MNGDPGPGEAGACFLGQVAAGWQEAQPEGCWDRGELGLSVSHAVAHVSHAMLGLWRAYLTNSHSFGPWVSRVSFPQV